MVVACPAANPTTAFYERNGFTPITAAVVGGNIVFTDTASSATALSVPLSSLSSTNDYFLLETFNDGSHTVVLMYGINAPGTLASGVYFDKVFGSLSTLTSSAYIIHWQGTTPNVPVPTDTYTIVYQA